MQPLTFPGIQNALFVAPFVYLLRGFDSERLGLLPADEKIRSGRVRSIEIQLRGGTAALILAMQ
jgi:hypothetical protein